MTRALFAVAAMIGATLLAIHPSQAEYAIYGNGRYCAVVSNGTGSVKEICDFNDFETCRLEVVSGNRGFCNNNPRWVVAHGPQWGGQPEGAHPAMRKSKRHRH